MPLSKRKVPQNLNSGAVIGNAMGGFNASYEDGLVKKAGSETLLGQTRNVINVGKSVADGIANAVGVRSPYYVIGEVRASSDWDNALSKLGTAGALVRAITQDTLQEGVIIDCLGDIDGTWAVDFTTQPIYYQTATAANSRIRVPTTLNAVVAISNYLSDNIIESTIKQALSNTMGTLGTTLANEILYNGNTRAQYGLYKLINLMESGTPFKVYTPHGTYDNMLIKNIKVKTTDKTMEMLYATIQFQEVIMAQPYYLGDNKLAKMPARTAISEAKNATLIGKLAGFVGL